MPTVTTQQLQQLQQMVSSLVADKTTADAKTQSSNAADTAAAQATAAAAQAKLDEAAADAAVSTDLSALQSFIDGLATPPPPSLAGTVKA